MKVGHHIVELETGDIIIATEKDVAIDRLMKREIPLPRKLFIISNPAFDSRTKDLFITKVRNNNEKSCYRIS